MNEKKILIYSKKPDLHSLYSVLEENPPKGYKIVLPKVKKGKIYQKLSKIKFAKFLYRILKRTGKDPIVSEALNSKKDLISSDISLLFSPGKLFLGEIPPYVIEIVDKPTALAGNDYKLFKKNRNFIRKQLEAPNCKKILCWNKGCKRDFEKEFNSSVINRKLEVIYLSKPLSKKNFKKNYDSKKINLLFVGSINNPDDFLIKGGIETLETFRILSEKHSNLHLYVKCTVPFSIKKRYKNLSNLHIIEGIISKEQLNSLYEKADIFMTPSHNLNAFAPLEAMEYKLPLIGINTWAVEEVIQNNENGFLVEKSKKIPYVDKKIHLDIRNPSFLKSLKKVDQDLINRLVNKTEILIKNPELRRKMGESGRKLVEKGKFAYSIRIRKLQNIFDEILNKN